MAEEDKTIMTFFPGALRLESTQKRILENEKVESMEWEKMIGRYNWTQLASICKVDNDSAAAVDPNLPAAPVTLSDGTTLPELVVDWDWGQTNSWKEHQCRVFLLHFTQRSSRKVVIRPGKF